MLDFIAYAAKRNFIGLTTNINLKRNGFDSENYRYGTTTNGTLNLFADLSFKHFTIRIAAGTYFEHAMMVESQLNPNELPFKHYDTGGNVWFGNGKLQLFTKHFEAFLEYQKPYKSSLYGYTQLLTKKKINTGIIYTF